MPTRDQKNEGIEAIKEAIRSINGDIPSGYEKSNLVISAKVNDKLIIDREIFETELHIRTNYGEVLIYWENSGYKGYKAMGLFGAMRTDYQIITSNNDNTLTVEDEAGSYFLTIEY